MYAVIFKAKIAKAKIATPDEQYSITAARMRDLAINDYGCLSFTACTEENREIAISYWPTLHHIKRWRQDPEHLAAQALGSSQWYESYEVDVVEIVRQYTQQENQKKKPSIE